MVQADTDPTLNDPAAQLLHAVAPGGLYVPEVQNMHSVWLDELLNCPPGQPWQLKPALKANEPGEQAVHDVAFWAGETLPTAQLVHPVALNKLKVPLRQPMHGVLCEIVNDPPRQVTHDV